MLRVRIYIFRRGQGGYFKRLGAFMLSISKTS